MTFALVAAAVGCVGCGGRGASAAVPDGVYEGVFTVDYAAEPFPGLAAHETGGVTVTLKEGRFVCSGNENHVPMAAEGTFSVKEGKIVFVSEGVYTADFDGNLVLDGEYAYTLDGDKLTFGAHKNGTGYYKYALVKKR